MAEKIDQIPEDDKWEFKLYTPYEFTINFNDDNQFKHSIDRPDKVKQKLYSILSTNPGIHYWLRLELSMPQYGQAYTKKQHIARLHYHGIIKFTTKKSLIKYLVMTYTKLTSIGRVQFNPFRLSHWPTYCLKQQYLFKHLNCDLENVELEYIVSQDMDQTSETD